MPHRTEKIESTLQRAIAEVLAHELSDPRIQGMVSVTRVDMSDDLRNATVYISVLPKEKQRVTIKGLRAANRHVHAMASKKVALRIMPRLEFKLDESLKKQADVLGAIHDAMERTGEAAQDTENAPAPLADDEE